MKNTGKKDFTPKMVPVRSLNVSSQFLQWYFWAPFGVRPLFWTSLLPQCGQVSPSGQRVCLIIL